MIADDVKEEILRRLERVEQEHNVKILFAIESGSRAWGFASPNSDYDVRFVYVHEPSWYQAVDLEERRDVIEYPIVDDIDLNGWDLRKALRLFWKSNPSFVEWIQSPITYIERGTFRQRALAALPQIYSPEKGIYHYRSMAKTNYRGYLQEDMVRLKKYFYCLRPILAAQWVANTGIAAPIEFDKLLGLISDQPSVLTEIHNLLDLKRNTLELGLSPAVPLLNQYIENALAEETVEFSKKPESPQIIDLLNDIFHCELESYR